MKKLTIFLVTLILLGYQSDAQRNKNMTDRLFFGLKAGVNSSTANANDNDGFSPESKLGLAAGLFLSIPLMDNIGIQPEILLSQKGFRATGIAPGDIYDFTRTTTYLDIPLMVAIKPVSFITLLAGPNYSRLLKDKYVFKNGSTSIEQEEDFINESSRKNSLGFGGGIDININHFVLSARAFADLQKNNKNKDAITPRYNNVWFQATLGYRLY